MSHFHATQILNSISAIADNPDSKFFSSFHQLFQLSLCTYTFSACTPILAQLDTSPIETLMGLPASCATAGIDHVSDGKSPSEHDSRAAAARGYRRHVDNDAHAGVPASLEKHELLILRGICVTVSTLCRKLHGKIMFGWLLLLVDTVLLVAIFAVCFVALQRVVKHGFQCWRKFEMSEK